MTNATPYLSTVICDSRPRQFYTDKFTIAVGEVAKNKNLTLCDSSASTVWDNSEIFGEFGQRYAADPKHLIPYYIHRQLPEAKCIVIMRNPVDKLYSDFLYFARFAPRHNPESFHRLSSDAIHRFRTCLENMSIEHCAYAKVPKTDLLSRLRIGLYYFHIRTWLRSYPRKQFHWVQLEHYSTNRAKVLHQLYKFLSLKEVPLWRIQSYINNTNVQNSNKQGYSKTGKMLPETRHMLTEFYRPYNRKLAKLLGDESLLYED